MEVSHRGRDEISLSNQTWELVELFKGKKTIERPLNLGNLTMDWERRKWDLMVGIEGGKLQKKDGVFKVEGPF
ncbi:hypothetical protein WN944_027309 [Citrus x changshan-huyou]|uniref:Uncharacterized protein n=1 Tax=Citrus x changshan-huyou TaxID=2935761 RepID=A0AAP0LIF3_9ROSI